MALTLGRSAGQAAGAPSTGPRVAVRFLAHGAERSGPPIYLLRLLQGWRRQRSPIAAEVVLARGGSLEPSFRSVADCRTAGGGRWTPEHLASRALVAAGATDMARSVRDRSMRARSGRSAATTTVVNGATQPTADLLRALEPEGEVLLIAHELSTGWCDNIDAEARDLLLERCDRFLAVSRCVADFLVEDLGVDRARVTVARPPVPMPATISAPDDDPPLVVGAGVHDWRKAPDLWLQVAARVRDRMGAGEVRFVWFGGHPADEPPAWPLRHDLRALDLADDVRFVGEVEELMPQLANASVFLATAREDAYPLVCAEACAAGVPVVSFGGGGAAELVADSGCGAVADYPDLEAMADHVVDLLRDPPRRARMARSGEEFARTALAPAVSAAQVERWILGGPS